MILRQEVMDLFGRKATALVKKLDRDNGILTTDIAHYRQTIRDIDKLIFQMSQLSSWAAQQPYFAELLEGTERRRLDESNRIGGLIIEELRKID